MNKKQYQKLCDSLYTATKAYQSGSPIMSDEEFDAKKRRVEEFEKTLPNDKIYKKSPSKVVGVAEVYGSTHSHLTPMLSIRDVFTLDELKKLIESSCGTKTGLVISPKLDGISASLIYINGILRYILTRGDGTVGRILPKEALNVPLTIPYTDTVEIRGEVVISWADFDHLVEHSEEGKIPKNPRNTVSGAMGLKDVNEIKSRRPQFVAYGCGYESFPEIDTEVDVMQKISDFGFTTILDKGLGCVNNIDNYKEISKKPRRDSALPIDGLVFKVNDRKMQKDLGVNNKYPRFAFALKFSAMSQFTELKEVIWQIGTKGSFTPVAIFDPVDLNGTEVSRATLHNPSVIREKNIQLFDEVEVIKSGDIIPKIISSRKTKYSKDIVLPTTCPHCSSSLEVTENELICNNEFCSGVIVQKLVSFGSVDKMNFKGISEKAVEKLYSAHKLRTYVDYFELTSDDLHYAGFGDKQSEIILDAIETARNTTLPRFLSALSIDGFGKTYANLIMSCLGNDFLDWSLDELLSIHGIGEITARNYIAYIEKHRGMIEKMLEHINIAYPKARDDVKFKALVQVFQQVFHQMTGNELENKTYSLTGKLFKPRKWIEEALSSVGLKYTSNVKKSGFILVGDKPTMKKLEDAKANNIPAIMGEDARDLFISL